MYYIQISNLKTWCFSVFVIHICRGHPEQYIYLSSSFLNCIPKTPIIIITNMLLKLVFVC